MKVYLAAIDKDETNNIVNLNRVRAVTAEEDRLIEIAIREVSICQNTTDFFSIAGHNYKAISGFKNMIIEKYKNKGGISAGHLHDVNVAFDRYIINYLAAARMFLDRTKFRLSKLGPRAVSALSIFERECSFCYDNSYSYRLLYKLRDFVLHCGLPPTEIKLHFKGGETKLSVYLIKNGLLASGFSWGKNTKEDIEKSPNLIDLETHLHDFHKCLARIYSIVAGRDVEIYKASICRIENLLKEIRDSGFRGSPCLSEEPDDIDVAIKNTGQAGMLVRWLPKPEFVLLRYPGI